MALPSAARGPIGSILAGAASLLLLVSSLAGRLPAELGDSLEVVAVLTGAWSVWLLASNRVTGWWLAVVSNALFGVVFFRVELFAEVGIQLFYGVTGLQAIWLWRHDSGGAPKTGSTRERPVGRVSARLWITALVAGLLAWVLLRHLLQEIGGAAPTWDALTTVLSLIAHLFLMWRLVDSWILWIVVDLIYMPLYISRGLELTAGLYFVFLLLSIAGLRRFYREWRQRTSAPTTTLASPHR